MRAFLLTIAALALAILTSAQGQSDAVKALFAETVEHSSLTAPGSQPFHMKLRVSDVRKEHHEFDTAIEIWWAAPDQWRREIKSSLFSQTAIQNGQQYSEINSADYLPWWLHNILRESLDPLPFAELQPLNLDLQAGDRCLKWDKTFAQGTDQIGISNSICFNPDGTLKNVFSRTADAQFDEYRNFGPKKIARVIDSDTQTADRGIQLRTPITFIEPLQDNPGLFAIATDTGLNARLRFISVTESALRDFKLSTPPPQWRVIHNLPNTGIMTVNLKIDRQGIVREVGSPISHNVALSDAAKEQLKTWRFKPYLVDGSPVQVSVDVAFPFKAKVEPYGANPDMFPVEKFWVRIHNALRLSDPRTEGGKPFHLVASFQYGEEPAGTYDETWISSAQWYREAALGGVTVAESRDGDHLYRKFTGSDFSPKKLDAVLDEFDGHFPRTDGSFIEGDWGNSVVHWRGADLLRVARGAVDEENIPTSGQAYWFDGAGLLHGAYAQPRTTVYGDFADWNGQQVPRSMEVSEDDSIILRIEITQLAPPAPNSIPSFRMEGVKATSAKYDDYSGPAAIAESRPIHQVKPVDPHQGRGTVLVDVLIDPRGHVRSATIKQSAGEMPDRAALEAAMQWEFTPMMIHGHAVPGSATLTFKF